MFVLNMYIIYFCVCMLSLYTHSCSLNEALIMLDLLYGSTSHSEIHLSMGRNSIGMASAGALIGSYKQE